MTNQNPEPSGKSTKQADFRTKTGEMLSLAQHQLRTNLNRVIEELRKSNTKEENKQNTSYIFGAYQELTELEKLAHQPVFDLSQILGLATGQLSKITVFFLSRVREMNNVETFKKSLARFWLNRVGRPAVFAEKGGMLFQDPNVEDKDLNSEFGSYCFTFDFGKEERERLKRSDPTKFLSALVYEQLHALTEGRLIDEGGMRHEHSHVALPKAENYYVVVHEGSNTKKVKISREDLEGDFHFFHEKFLSNLRNTPIIDMNLAENDFPEAFAGEEVIQNIQSRKVDLHDATAADMSITISRSDEMSIDDIQRDKRNYTHGIRIPVAWRIGIREEKPGGRQIIDTAGVKASHPYTDGAPEYEECEKVIEKVFHRGLMGQNEKFDGDYEKNHSYLDNRNTVTEATINGERTRNTLNTIYDFFSKELPADKAIKLTPNVILQYATMLTLRTTFMQFLEQNQLETELGVALSIFPEEVLEFFKNPPSKAEFKKEHIMNNVNSLLQAMKRFGRERVEVRNGRGITQILAVMSQGAFQAMLQLTGTVLDPHKTAMLINTVSSSQLVGGKDQYQSKYRETHPRNQKILSLRAFSGAFAKVYPKNVIAFCDMEDGNIKATLRSRIQDPDLEGRFAKELQSNVDKILGMLIAYRSLSLGVDLGI